jgi:hypothetical protein
MTKPNNFHFFYGGPFSQWFKSEFVVDGVTYLTAEQYMMAGKARVFNDDERLAMILEAKNPWDQKMHGRMVEGFNDAEWNKHRIKIVIDANIAKFGQNEQLKKYMFDTGDKELVEASPVDKIWGIGLDEHDPKRFDRKNWKGKNLLGICLMDVRKKFMDEK